MVGGESPGAIQFEGVSFTLPDGKALLEDLSVEVHQGETLILLGRSGSGKTTTMKLINRLLDPTRGRVVVEGRATTDWDPIRLRRRIGYVIQEIGLFPHFTVAQNVGLVPHLEKWDDGRIKARVDALLELVVLYPPLFSQRYPQELSGLQRRGHCCFDLAIEVAGLHPADPVPAGRHAQTWILDQMPFELHF